MNESPQESVGDDKRRAGRKEGERRRDHAHLILEARRARYILLARRAMLMALLRDGTATIDVVREAVPLPADIKPALFGPAVRGLALAGIIKKVRSEPTKRTNRPIAHARDVRLWELVSNEAAEQWLAEHPPPTDLDDGSPTITQPPSNDTGPATVIAEPALDFCI